MSRFIQSNGIRMHLVEDGGGPLVVLLHGFPEFWYGWRYQLGPLAAAGLRVVAPDLRGYNLSSKPRGLANYVLDALADDVLGLADALGRSRFAIGGHDWGGVLAWHLAARDPARIERAAILNAPHPATMRAFARAHPGQLARSWYVAFFQLPGLPERVLRAGDHAWLANGLTGSSRPGTFGDADLANYRRAWAQPGALTAMLAWYRAVRLQQPPTTPHRVEVPVRVIWGDGDRFLDHRLAEAGLAACDRSDVHHLGHASHWVQHEEPDEVNRLLGEFLV
jgi:epoxide hydrolase 4